MEFNQYQSISVFNTSYIPNLNNPVSCFALPRYANAKSTVVVIGRATGVPYIVVSASDDVLIDLCFETPESSQIMSFVNSLAAKLVLT